VHPAQPRTRFVLVAELMPEAPPRRRLVEILRDPLHHDQDAVRDQEFGGLACHDGRIVHVVQGQRRDDRVGWTLRAVLLERGPHVRRAFRCLGIDTRRVVPGPDQRRDMPADRPAAQFDHPARRRGQLAADERPGRRQPGGIGGSTASRVFVACVVCVAAGPAFIHAAC